MRKTLVLFLVTFLCVLCVIALAQDDSPSLGDVARQSRAQKQQKTSEIKDASAGNSKGAAQPKTAHVISNDEISASAAPEPAATSTADAEDFASKDSALEPPASNREAAAERWKKLIQHQKEAITRLEHEISELGASIHFASPNCVQNCEQKNERQLRKQEQVESMKTQLEAAKHQLEEMQEAARKQGFGSSVYEP